MKSTWVSGLVLTAALWLGPCTSMDLQGFRVLKDVRLCSLCPVWQTPLVRRGDHGVHDTETTLQEEEKKLGLRCHADSCVPKNFTNALTQQWWGSSDHFFPGGEDVERTRKPLW